MKAKLNVLFLLIMCQMNAQKVTKILYKDTSYTSVGGIMYKKPSHRMIIDGVYNGKNLFIKNSFGAGGIGYCINGLKVNGNYTTDEINADQFGVDLSLHKLKLGEKFQMLIFYKDSCSFKEPLLMNPSAIAQRNPSGKNTMVIEGVNYNANLLVMNPRSANGYGIKEVLVNGIKVEKIAMDVFDISFFEMKIPYQAKVKIEFKYENDCDPFIINPEVINY